MYCRQPGARLHYLHVRQHEPWARISVRICLPTATNPQISEPRVKGEQPGEFPGYFLAAPFHRVMNAVCGFLHRWLPPPQARCSRGRAPHRAGGCYSSRTFASGPDIGRRRSLGMRTTLWGLCRFGGDGSGGFCRIAPGRPVSEASSGPSP